ncbi:autotransporter adhesin protein [Herbaspirillum sp. GW103]|uniref:hypothetical protein n=1 Tax=Herbaspirillum sp. GW103 TaxID=1175306 RepID=UPI00025E4626|nr:hypothetical protein [Herbaspirillum sp. GW103]EIJ44428.1 autotransporter adhesin protein [Herbaspirillum sp. GW103]
MSVTVLNLTEASTLLRTINKRDIKDVRAIDNDLALVMENGHKIIISRGAVTAVNSPQLVLEFADGDVALGDVFEKLNHIEVPNDATAPLTASEVKRYGIKRVVKAKAKDTAKDKDEEQAEARAEVDDGKPVATLASDGALKQPLAASEVAQKSAIPSSSLTEGSSTQAADNGGGLSFSWPLVAGGLGLLAAAAGGGGGGGGGGQSGAAAVPKAGTTLSGATVLGPLNNATITAYDSQGNVIGKPVPVINGRYSLVLDQPDYKGLILLAVRDNTPGVADNFADEATAPDSNGQVGYVSSKLPLTEGQVWLKARIVRTAAQSGVAQGSTRELGSELKFTLDKTAPAQVPLRMDASGDDGISSADGISSQTGMQQGGGTSVLGSWLSFTLVNGNDDIALGATRYGAATFVQTGAGQDKIIVGSFGHNDNLSATVGDFTLGVDKVEVFNQTLTLANLSRFVTASAGANANDTRLTIDLDGAGPGTVTYTLMLQNVMYNSANTASIFGL